MPKYAEKRKYLFERTSPVTPIPSPLRVNNSNNYNINWVQNLVKTSKQCYSENCDQQKTQQENCESSIQLNYDKCCHLDHIS